MLRVRRGSRELWGLILLFVVFVASATYYEQLGQQLSVRETPGSSINPQGPGAKALYLLLDREGYAVRQLETPWNGLDRDDGLLVVIEPLDRPPVEAEIDPLHAWVQRGGSVLFLVTAPEQPLDPADTVAGDVEVVDGPDKPETVKPVSSASPFVQAVSEITVSSPVRLRPAPHSSYETLFQDESGALVVHKPLGKGQVILVAGSLDASNATVKQADNVVFFMDVVAATVGSTGRRVVFDEYHHGVGFAEHAGDESGPLANLPVPGRLALWHAMGLGALLLYNGNRRFGRPRSLGAPTYRPSTDYVGSMAHLLQRAGAADVALQTLYRGFVRDLSRAVGSPSDMPPANLVPLAVRMYGIDGEALGQMIAQCEQVEAGARIGDAEMLRVAQSLADFRRRCHLVGDR